MELIGTSILPLVIHFPSSVSSLGALLLFLHSLGPMGGIVSLQFSTCQHVEGLWELYLPGSLSKGPKIRHLSH